MPLLHVAGHIPDGLASILIDAWHVSFLCPVTIILC